MCDEARGPVVQRLVCGQTGGPFIGARQVGQAAEWGRLMGAGEHEGDPAAEEAATRDALADREAGQFGGVQPAGDGGQDPAARTGLPDPVAGDLQDSAGGDHPVVRRRGRVPGQAVPDDEFGSMAARAESDPGPGRHVRIDLYGGDTVRADPMAQQRGGVPGAGADLQYPVAIGDAELFQHAQHQPRHGAGGGGGPADRAADIGRDDGAGYLRDQGIVAVAALQPGVVAGQHGPPPGRRGAGLPLEEAAAQELVPRHRFGRRPPPIRTEVPGVRKPTDQVRPQLVFLHAAAPLSSRSAMAATMGRPVSGSSQAH